MLFFGTIKIYKWLLLKIKFKILSELSLKIIYRLNLKNHYSRRHTIKLTNIWTVGVQGGEERRG